MGDFSAMKQLAMALVLAAVWGWWPAGRTALAQSAPAPVTVEAEPLVRAPAVPAPVVRPPAARAPVRRVARPRIDVRPYYPYRRYHSVYPLPYDIEYPGPYARRDCSVRYVTEYRPSGNVVTARTRCWWVRG